MVFEMDVFILFFLGGNGKKWTREIGRIMGVSEPKEREKKS